MLQPGLRPVLHFDGSAGICSVLRKSLGYTIAACAQMLGIDKSGVRGLFQLACHSASTEGHSDRRFTYCLGATTSDSDRCYLTNACPSLM
jgi:hypothetical protein